jgi:hypothetical protein
MGSEEKIVKCKHCGTYPIFTSSSDRVLLVCPKCNYAAEAPLKLERDTESQLTTYPIGTAQRNLERLAAAKEEVIKQWNDYNNKPDEAKKKVLSYRKRLVEKLGPTIIQCMDSHEPNEVADVIVNMADAIIHRLKGKSLWEE